jgi:predicted dehydrogenase
MDRRDFVKLSGAGVSLAMMTNSLAGAEEPKKYRVGLIGVGWYGKNDLFRLMQVWPVEVVSLCDVDQRRLKEGSEMVAARQTSGKTPRTYTDYREMLKEKDLDIVVIGTPDHWHSLQTIAAIEAGADVYVQKPVSRDILEGEAMVAAARRHQRVVQVGTQRKSTPHIIDAKKTVVDAGLLGKVGHVEICCYYHMRANGSPENSAAPDYFDYEMWTGPAPLRPYDQIPHERWWRTFMEYGNGIVGDMCVHMLDTTRHLLGLGWPTQVSSTGGIYVEKGGKSNIADTQSALFQYDGLNVVWQHRTWGSSPDAKYPWALMIYGDHGTLKVSSASYDFIPEGRGQSLHKDCVIEREEFPEDEKEPKIDLQSAPATRANMKDFLAAIASRGKPIADIEQGHISTASCILANVSMQLGGRPLRYDPQKRVISGDDEATQLLRQGYRAPWIHPASGMV